MLEASTVVCGSGASVTMAVGGIGVAVVDEFATTVADVEGRLQAARTITISKPNNLRIKGPIFENGTCFFESPNIWEVAKSACEGNQLGELGKQDRAVS
jgi:hypothetical protein